MKLLALLLVSGAVLFGQSGTIDSGSPADMYFVGGSTSIMTNPPAGITDLTTRYGDFSYNIPVANVPYVLTLNWIEQTVGGTNQRLFQVAVNDQVIFDKLDLLAICGWLKPCSRAIVVVPTSNVIHVVFTTEKRSAIVSSIDYVPLAQRMVSGTPFWLATVKSCDPASVTATASCASMYLLSVLQSGGSMANYFAAPATPEEIASMNWK